MLECSPLLSSDFGDLPAMSSRLSLRGIGKVMHLVMLIVGTSLVVAEHRLCSPEVAQRLGWRESGRSPYSSLSIASLCDTGHGPSHGRSE